MSNWTHVAGVIRIDDIRGLIHEDVPDFDKLIGKEMLYEDWKDVGQKEWEKAFDKRQHKYLPMGSEGSLQKSVWIDEDDHQIAAYTVSIFGDLRDHDSAKDIVKWFQKLLKRIEKQHYMIRQATITVENEWNGTENWTYEDEEEGEEGVSK